MQKEGHHTANVDLSRKVSKTIVKGAAFSFAGMFLYFVAEYLTRIIIARHLGLSGYGIINLAVAVMTIVGTLSLCGLGSGITRFISYYLGKKRQDKVKSSIISGIQIIMPTSITSGIAVFIFADRIASDLFKEPQLTSVLRVFALCIPVFCLSGFFVSVFRGFKKIKYMVYIRAGFILGSRLLFLICFVLLGFGLLGVSSAYFIGWSVSSIASVFLFKTITRKYQGWKETKVLSTKKELFHFSLPLMASDVLSKFRGKIDTILIGYFIAINDVALYNVALPIAKILQLGLTSLNSIFMPSISELYGSGNLQELNETYKRVAKWGFCVTLPLFLVFIWYSKTIIIMLFGIEYQKASPPMILLTIGVFINVTSGPFGETLIAIGRTKTKMLLIMLFVFINLVLNIILIPKVGLIGAAIANSFSLAIFCIASLLCLYRYLNLQPFSLGHLKCCLSAFVSIAFLNLVRSSLLHQTSGWSLIVFIVCLYLLTFLGFYLLKGFDVIEINIIKAIYKKMKLR